MSRVVIAEIKKNHIQKLLAQGKRTDGRGLKDVRKIDIITGYVESADGSALVRYGDTEVIVGVKIIPGTPFADTPGKGVLTTGAELIPMAHPMFESGPPSEDAVELARVVDRGVRESGMVDVDALCIVAGESVWMCFIDIYALNYDGNLFDAASLATVCALRTAIVPGEQYGKGANKPLPVRCTPVSVTAAKIGNDLILDPNFDEEHISSARLTITTDDDGSFRAMQKGGMGSFTPEELKECLDRAVAKGREIRKIIG
jgi:exosome complex component RRP42